MNEQQGQEISDQATEVEQGAKATKVSSENFTGEQQAQATEKFSTWSGEEPKKVLLAAKPGETLEEFKERTRQYQEELERKAKDKPIEPLTIGGFEDGSEVTAAGRQQSIDKMQSPPLKLEPGNTVCIDPRPSYIEGLKAIGQDEAAQGQYSIAYIERKVSEARAREEGGDETVTDVSARVPAGSSRDLEGSNDSIDAARDPGVPPDLVTASKGDELETFWNGQPLPSPVVPDFLYPMFEKLGATAWELFKKENPLQGYEDALLSESTRHDREAWDKAMLQFPELHRHDNLGPLLLQAYVRNELEHYDRFDRAEDFAVAAGKNLDDKTLGMSQITPIGVRKFETQFPQLKKFLESKGYSGPGHEAKALLDPECIPMIVAAKTATIVSQYEKHKVPIDNNTVAYGFNADVYSWPADQKHPEKGRTYQSLYGADVYVAQLQHEGFKKEMEPKSQEGLSASQHVANVQRHLTYLQSHHN